MFLPVGVGVMALTIFKQILLNFNTLTIFKVVKCLQMTKKKKKKFRKAKQKYVK